MPSNPKWIALNDTDGRKFATDARSRAEPPTPAGIDLDYWPLFSVTDDQSSNAHSSTLVSTGPTRVADGSLFVADFSGTVALHFPVTVPSEWTIMVSAKPDDITNFKHLCGAGPSGAANADRWGVLYLRDTPSSADGGVRVIWGDDSSACRIDSDDPVFLASEYSCFGVRFTTGTADVKIVSGFDDVNTTVTEGNATTCAPPQHPFYIGMGGAYTSQKWAGKVARLWVWRKRLSDFAFNHYLAQLADAYCGA